MSFILEALRRAERERSLGQAPRIEDVALAGNAAKQPGASTPARPLPWVALSAIAVMLVALVLFFTVGQRRPAEVVAAPPTALSPAVPSPAPKAAPATSPSRAAAPSTPPVSTRPAVAVDESLSTLDDLTADSGTPELYPMPPPEPDYPPAPSRDQTAVATRTPAPAAEAAQAPMQPANEIDQPEVSTLRLDPAPPSAPPASSLLPRLSDMPASFRAEFPPITLDVHAWNEDPQRRFTLIEGRRYKEGDVLAQGPQLVEILPDGLLLEYRGQRLLYALDR